jgi:hypothetical protein
MSRLAGLLIDSNNLIVYVPNQTTTALWVSNTSTGVPMPVYGRKFIGGGFSYNGATGYDNGSGAAFQAPAVSGTGGSISLGAGGAPSSPAAGQIYYSAASSTFYGYAGSAWAEMTFPDITDITAGKVGIGTSTPGSTLDVNGNVTDEKVAGCNGGSGGLGTTATGTVFCQVSFSDARLKTGVSSLDPSASLALVDSLNPVSFYWLDPTIPGTNSTAEQYGFLAQDVEQVAPNLVATTSSTYLTPGGTLYLNYQGIIPLLANAIRAQEGEIGTATTSLSRLTVGQNSLAAAASTTAVTLQSLAAAQLSLSQALASSTLSWSAELAAVASSTATSTLASSNASVLSSSQPFIQSVANAVLSLLESSGEAVSSAGDWAVHQITAALAVFTDVRTQTIETQTASVANGISMTDQATGQVYCVQIRNGDFVNTPGACSAASSTPPQASSTDVQAPPADQQITNAVQNPPSPNNDAGQAAAASSTASAAASTTSSVGTTTTPTSTPTPANMASATTTPSQSEATTTPSGPAPAVQASSTAPVQQASAPAQTAASSTPASAPTDSSAGQMLPAGSDGPAAGPSADAGAPSASPPASASPTSG